MKLNRTFAAVFFLLITTLSSTAQGSADSTVTGKKNKLRFFVIPLLFYTPETRWGGGAAGISLFHFKGQPDTVKPSQLIFGFAYTQEHQVLAYLPYDLFFKGGHYRTYGEIGYYQFFYHFYGIGVDTLPPNGEVYGLNYPRIRFNGLRFLGKHFFAGARYWYDNNKITSTEPGGVLESDLVPGTKGGPVSGLGPLLVWDSRNRIFSPSDGWYAEAALMVYHPAIGSQYRFTRWMLDVSRYIRTWKEQVLGINVYGEMNNGTPPFNMMALLGGHRRLRGYYLGRFADKQLMEGQVEYRMPLFWRIGAVAFAGTGMVAPDFGAFSNASLHPSWGGGFRIAIDKTSKINLRVDGGFTPVGHGYYVTLKEAF